MPRDELVERHAQGTREPVRGVEADLLGAHPALDPVHLTDADPGEAFERVLGELATDPLALDPSCEVAADAHARILATASAAAKMGRRSAERLGGLLR